MARGAGANSFIIRSVSASSSVSGNHFRDALHMSEDRIDAPKTSARKDRCGGVGSLVVGDSADRPDAEQNDYPEQERDCTFYMRQHI